MAAQKTEETIVFLPWTVEPQPQTQAVILQQPSETHLRLDATTDKTAISSFVIATIIALALGGFATWLAYWYGWKSFYLTEMSFRTVSEEIKQAAETHRLVNAQILASQKNNKDRDIKLAFNKEWSNQLIGSLSEFTADLDDWILTVVGLSNEIRKEKERTFNFELYKDKHFMGEIKELHKQSENIKKIIGKVVIYVSLFNGDREYNETLFLLNSLKLEMLEIQRKYIHLEIIDTEIESIYGKNLLIFSKVNELLQNEKSKIEKAA